MKSQLSSDDKNTYDRVLHWIQNMPVHNMKYMQ